jgi:membrane fusion protein (multidrug efflux system)
MAVTRPPRTRGRLIKRLIIMLAIVILVFGGIFGFQIFKSIKIKEFMSGFAMPPQTVSTVTAGVSEWRSQISAVGSLRAVNGADLALEVGGIVESISFKSGDMVDAGAVLLTLRSGDDVARLEALKATADLAQINYDRDVKQLKIQAVSQAQVDADLANLNNAKAQVAQQEAVIAKKTVKAPFAGQLGLRSVDVGQYLTAGTAIVTLQALDPVYVDFYLPQQMIDQLKVGQKVTVRVDAFPELTFPGDISAIDAKVNASSRNVQVRATLPNKERKLLPGMYATVEIDTGNPQRHVTVPQTAITYNSYGATVYIVDNKGKGPQGQDMLVARQSFITVGPTRGDQVAILKGVNQGDVVVTAGQVKLRNGVPVVIDNSVQPSNDPNPKPTDK